MLKNSLKHLKKKKSSSVINSCDCGLLTANWQLIQQTINSLPTAYRQSTQQLLLWTGQQSINCWLTADQQPISNWLPADWSYPTSKPKTPKKILGTVKGTSMTAAGSSANVTLLLQSRKICTVSGSNWQLIRSWSTANRQQIDSWPTADPTVNWRLTDSWPTADCRSWRRAMTSARWATRCTTWRGRASCWALSCPSGTTNSIRSFSFARGAFRAGHFRYFLIFSIMKNDFVAFFIKLITYFCTSSI